MLAIVTERFLRGRKGLFALFPCGICVYWVCDWTDSAEQKDTLLKWGETTKFNTEQGTGERAQQLRPFGAFSEDPALVPSTWHIWLTATCNSSSKGSDTFLSTALSYTCPYTHTPHIEIKSFKTLDKIEQESQGVKRSGKWEQVERTTGQLSEPCEVTTTLTGMTYLLPLWGVTCLNIHKEEGVGSQSPLGLMPAFWEVRSDPVEFPVLPKLHTMKLPQKEE